MPSQIAKEIHLFLLQNRYDTPYWTTGALAAHFDMTVYQMRHHLLALLKEQWIFRSIPRSGLPVVWWCRLIVPEKS